VRFFSGTFLRLLETYGFLYRACKNVIYSQNDERRFNTAYRAGIRHFHGRVFTF
jgi:hypothetical protein